MSTERDPRLSVVDGAWQVEYLDDRDLFELTTMSRAFWAKLRVTGGGPPYLRVGRRVVYRWADVAAWLDARRVTP